MARTKALDLTNFLFVLLLILVYTSQLAVCGSVVKLLPGFQGPLPFELETGYVGVGESEDVQLFYYFVKSERNASEDPLLLWLTGGPGCSTLSAFLFEIGPLYPEVEEYNGGLPTIHLNPNSWSKVANIIFLDLPAGTGFSYARTAHASKVGDLQQIHQADQFLRKWLVDHPEFFSNPLFIGGDSYSGMIVPPLVQEIADGNEKGIKPQLNIKGYLLGNAGTDPTAEGNSKIPFAHGMGLIPDELYESLKTSCGGEYQTIDPNNTECWINMMGYYQCTLGLNTEHVLEPLCAFASPRPMAMIAIKRQSFADNSGEEEPLLKDDDPPLPSKGCRNYGHLIGTYWITDVNVQRALHVREGSIEKWLRCNYGLSYEYAIGNTVKYHKYLLGEKGFRALIYSGDHDFIAPFIGTQSWIRSLDYSIVEDWRPWYAQGQIAGYTRVYANQLTYATMKGAGHTAPEYKPAECLAMFERWVHQEPL